jgi:hypothetical protein
MNVLGINAYHGDVAAALVREGELVAAVEEERCRYRLHKGQELRSTDASEQYARALLYGWAALGAPDCSLDAEEVSRARRLYTRRILRVAGRHLRRGRWSVLRSMFRGTGFRLWDFLKYPPVEATDATAGTPLDEIGEYVVPEWLRTG